MDYIRTNIHTHNTASEPWSLLNIRLTSPGQAFPAPPVLFSAGVHPWDAETAADGLTEKLRAVPGIKAIGETGLDYACGVDLLAQEQILRSQLRIAEQSGLPVILHCVRAFEPLSLILKEYELPGAVFHGFTGSPEQAARAVASGCGLSFGPRSFASPRAVESMRRTPIERLFLETDDGPQDINGVYEAAAEILGLQEERLAESVMQNFKTFLRL